MPVIGFLSPVSAATSARNIAALRQGLRNLGYVEGRDIAIEYRFAEGISERLSRFTAELVELKPVAIVVGSTTGIVRASKITQTVPLIVIGATDDPVLLGLAESISRPGRNVTGFMLTLGQDILGKKLQLLRDVIPGLSRVGVMGNPDSPGDAAELRMVPSLAGQIGLQYRLLEVRTVEELEAAFPTAARDELQALYFVSRPLCSMFIAARIVAMVAGLRLPAMYGFRDFVEPWGVRRHTAQIGRTYIGVLPRTSTKSSKVRKWASCRCNRREATN